MSRFHTCCQKLLHQASTETRAVICEKLIRPLRLVTTGSLLLHLVYRFISPPQFYSSLLIAIHLLIALLLLAECRRSKIYFDTIREYEALDKRRKATT